MNSPQKSYASAGNALIDHAHTKRTSSKLPKTTQLFPYLFVASRTMATREMSEWLKNEHGIEISAFMISKGLKRPELHCRRIAKHVEPLARYLSAISGYPVDDILNGKAEPGQTRFQYLAEDLKKVDEISSVTNEILESFSETWDLIPEEIKLMCSRYFTSPDDSEASGLDTDDDDETDQADDNESPGS